MFLTSIGLGMDAFSVSICKGLSMEKYKFRYCFIVGVYFGLFQGLMPLIGYFLGNRFIDIISDFDHYIIFFLLGIVGFNMIRDSFYDISVNDDLCFTEMILLSIATSIDALAVGITFSLLKVNIFKVVLMISIITFIMCFIGVIIGYVFGIKYNKKVQIIGGCILMILGIKILIEHLFFL